MKRLFQRQGRGRGHQRRELECLYCGKLELVDAREEAAYDRRGCTTCPRRRRCARASRRPRRHLSPDARASSASTRHGARPPGAWPELVRRFERLGAAAPPPTRPAPHPCGDCYWRAEETDGVRCASASTAVPAAPWRWWASGRRSTTPSKPSVPYRRLRRHGRAGGGAPRRTRCALAISPATCSATCRQTRRASSSPTCPATSAATSGASATGATAAPSTKTRSRMAAGMLARRASTSTCSPISASRSSAPRVSATRPASAVGAAGCSSIAIRRARRWCWTDWDTRRSSALLARIRCSMGWTTSAPRPARRSPGRSLATVGDCSRNLPDEIEDD